MLSSLRRILFRSSFQSSLPHIEDKIHDNDNGRWALLPVPTSDLSISHYLFNCALFITAARIT